MSRVRSSPTLSAVREMDRVEGADVRRTQLGSGPDDPSVDRDQRQTLHRLCAIQAPARASYGVDDLGPRQLTRHEAWILADHVDQVGALGLRTHQLHDG
jgi:hypothetical protein